MERELWVVEHFFAGEWHTWRDRVYGGERAGLSALRKYNSNPFNAIPTRLTRYIPEGD